MKSRCLSKLLPLLLMAAIMSACSGSGKLATRNFAGMYSRENVFGDLALAAYNSNDSVSCLYFGFPLEKLAYVKKGGNRPVARYQLHYSLYDGYRKGMLVDSGTYQGADSLLLSAWVSDSVLLRAARGRDYILDVVFTDLNARQSAERLINLSKSVPGQTNDFLLTGGNGRPLLRNFVSTSEQIRVRSGYPLDSAARFLHYTFPVHEAAVAPFSYDDTTVTFRFPVEDTRKIDFSGLVSFPFSLREQGIYRLDNSREPGFCINRFYDGFPAVTAAKMREALQYIATDAEFESMQVLPPKAAVDQFWVSLSGNSERALEQIKRYYSRVESANKWFSNTMEGWKSDRGMIYIVFGSPTVVYRNAEIEEWSYGAAGHPQSVRFFFQRIFSDTGTEEYKLIRVPEYRGPWHLAVSNWRR